MDPTPAGNDGVAAPAHRPAPLPPDEAGRLASLNACGVFDTKPEPEFDDLARLAARLCGTEFALVTLIGATRQHFKARVGTDLDGTPRDISFCAHAILTPDRLTVVPDATLDERFRNSPLVVGGPKVRFYAGAPLVAADGHALGTICALDTTPREMTADASASLEALGRLAARLLDLKRSTADRDRIQSAMRARNAALASQRAFLDNLVAVLPTAVFWKDRDSVFLGCNDAFARATGLTSAADVVGLTDHDLLPDPALADRYRADDLLVLDTGEPRLCYDEPYRRPDGSAGTLITSKSPMCDAAGNVVGVLGAFQDVTDARRAEAALARSNALARAQQEASIDAILVVDAAGKVVSLNERFFEVWDLPADRRRAEPPFADDFLPFLVEHRVADPDGFVARVRELQDRPGDTSRDEVPLKDGRTLDRYSAPLPATGGGGSGGGGRIWYFRDITDRKRGEDALRLARDAADAASRSKTEFLANMSHEIRTPMTAILGFADLLDEPGQSDADRRSCVGTIRRNGDHLLGVINDILDVAKVEAGQMTVERLACSPVQVVADVSSLLRARALAKGLAFDVLYDGPVPATIQTDPTRLRQVLTNLVSNAVKFTEKGDPSATAGRVEVLVDLLGGPGDDRPRLRVRVTDNGPGLSGEQQARLFQPFQQADTSTTRKHGGTGLGLTICRHLVGLLGGRVEVSSTPGRGSTFCFTVETGPLGDVAMLGRPGVRVPEADLLVGDQALVAPAAPAAPSAVAASVGRVLLAEDGPDNQRLIGLLLRRAGLEVEIVGTGRDAVDAVVAPGITTGAVSGGAAFDLVLMDMQMPVMDGYAAVAELRRLGHRGPVVALTAHAMAGDRTRCREAGCDDYLSKPIDRAAFAETVAAWLPGGEKRRDLGTRLDAERAAASAGAEAEVEVESVAVAEYVAPPRLVSTLAGDADLGAIVAMFVADLPRRAAELRAHLAAGDVEGVGRLVHQLGGAGGSYGLPAISDLAAEAEASLRSAPPDWPANARLALATAEVGTLLDLIATVRQGGPAPEPAPIPAPLAA